MTRLTIALLAALIFAVALLYSTVGHAGASGYLAAMALFGVAPEVMKPTALTLNILVSLVAATRFYRAGFFTWRIFWPFALTSIPASFIGGGLTLPGHIYKLIVGVVLLYSALRLFLAAKRPDREKPKHAPLLIALTLGAALGLLSGLTGVGGGIFLSPLLLLMGWARTKETAAVSAVFILVNSTAGLLGHVTAVAAVPRAIFFWAPLAVVGGWIGSELGTRKLPIPQIRQWLAVVLILAGLKLIFA
jgi:uncharacterized membrane protein YfcA